MPASELTPYTPPATDLVKFAEEASNVHKVAIALSTTSFVPKAFQGKPDEITGAILAGRELGLPPMTALATIHVIEGRPTMSANALRGMAMAAGVVFEVLEASDTRVHMRARPPGAQQWTESDWPIERARLMGLTNKSNWQKMPQAMLTARATSELCRLVAANVVMGMPYSREEMQDTTDAAPAPRTSRARSKPIPATVGEEPPLEEPPPVWDETAFEELGETLAKEGADFPPDGRVIGRQEIEAAPEPEPEPEPDAAEKIRDVTRKAIMAGFNELNVKDRNERLAKVTSIVGREIFSVNMLTEAEGRTVVRQLVNARDWPRTARVPS